MFKQKSVGIRHCLLWLTCLGFACRALVPVGYMPAAVGEGGPFALCHGGIAGALLERLGTGLAADGHAHASEAAGPHAEGHSHDGVGGEGSAAAFAHAHHPLAADGHEQLPADGSSPAFYDCPLGVALGAPAVASSPVLHLPTLDFSPPLADARVFVRRAHTLSHRPRAPPIPASA